MKVSAVSQISADESANKRNIFISFSNRFMSAPTTEDPVEKAFDCNSKPKHSKMGIENLEEFTIFPKENVNGKTVITA